MPQATSRKRNASRRLFCEDLSEGEKSRVPENEPGVISTSLCDPNLTASWDYLTRQETAASKMISSRLKIGSPKNTSRLPSVILRSPVR